MAKRNAPAFWANRNAFTTSGVSPECEKATTRSSDFRFASFRVMVKRSVKASESIPMRFILSRASIAARPDAPKPTNITRRAAINRSTMLLSFFMSTKSIVSCTAVSMVMAIFCATSLRESPTKMSGEAGNVRSLSSSSSRCSSALRLSSPL